MGVQCTPCPALARRQCRSWRALGATTAGRPYPVAWRCSRIPKPYATPMMIAMMIDRCRETPHTTHDKTPPSAALGSGPWHGTAVHGMQRRRDARCCVSQCISMMGHAQQGLARAGCGIPRRRDAISCISQCISRMGHEMTRPLPPILRIEFRFAVCYNCEVPQLITHREYASEGCYSSPKVGCIVRTTDDHQTVICHRSSQGA
jgi:hypothetical protein